MNYWRIPVGTTAEDAKEVTVGMRLRHPRMPSELVNQFEAFKLGEFQDSFELANKALEATLVGPV